MPSEFTSKSMTFDKINPATGDVLAHYPCADVTAIQAAVKAATLAQIQWQATSLPIRAQILKAIAARIRAEAETLAAIISLETGKSLSDALEADIGCALAALNFYARRGARVLAPQWLWPDTISFLTLRQHWQTAHPRGVLAIISPWNYPVAIPVGAMAAAMMAGNAVVLKPSEHTPATGEKLIQIFQEALTANGMPAALVQCVTGEGSTGAALIDQAIQGVVFTGSGAVGQVIQRQTADRNLWTSLELGGSDAMIILPQSQLSGSAVDDYLETVASFAVWGRFANAGQACAAVKRLYVPAAWEARLLVHLQRKIKALVVGPPSADTHPHFGPLISAAQRAHVHAQVEDAIARGATLLTGGKQLAEKGWFYSPTLFTQVPADARILTEEVFGPVLPVCAYNDINTVIATLNTGHFGLTTSLFGPEADAGKLATNIESGTVLINDVGISNFAMMSAPWGGWKESGRGASHGEQALLSMSRTKIVSYNLLRWIPGMKKPMWLFTAPDSPAQTQWRTRAGSVMALGGKGKRWWQIATWKSFWTHRASTKL